ncbi:MAG: hypothetical protein U0235_03805 [Polyangiaceae bacterium]
MVSKWVSVSACLIGSVALWACYSGTGEDDVNGAAAGSSSTDTRGASSTPSTTVPGSDLSCEIATFLAEKCQSCHGKTPRKDARISLLGRADLVAPSSDDPSKKVADVVLERIKASDASGERMPPAPDAPATKDEISLFEKWVASGEPTESCGASDTPPPPPAADDPFATPSACVSNKFWKNGDQGSDDMHPGKPCLSCHGQFPQKAFFKAPFDIAGTVYSNGHAPDDCYGATGVKVVITDANGKEVTLDVSAAGNFGHSGGYGFAKLATPYRAKVVKNGKERVMKDAQTNGDCNHCHSEKGDEKAPGRIMAP